MGEVSMGASETAMRQARRIRQRLRGMPAAYERRCLSCSLEVYWQDEGAGQRRSAVQRWDGCASRVTGCGGIWTTGHARNDGRDPRQTKGTACRAGADLTVSGALRSLAARGRCGSGQRRGAALCRGVPLVTGGEAAFERGGAHDPAGAELGADDQQREPEEEQDQGGGSGAGRHRVRRPWRPCAARISGSCRWRSWAAPGRSPFSAS